MTPQFLIDFVLWLQDLPAGAYFRETSWIIPTVQFIHIAAIAVVMGSILMIDLRALNVTGHSRTLASITSSLMPMSWSALVILLFTGAVMIVGDPNRTLTNPAFQLKMLMVIIAFALMAVFQSAMVSDREFWSRSPISRFAAKLMAVMSLTLFVAIIFAGRLIAYI